MWYVHCHDSCHFIGLPQIPLRFGCNQEAQDKRGTLDVCQRSRKLQFQQGPKIEAATRIKQSCWNWLEDLWVKNTWWFLWIVWPNGLRPFAKQDQAALTISKLQPNILLCITPHHIPQQESLPSDCSMGETHNYKCALSPPVQQHLNDCKTIMTTQRMSDELNRSWRKYKLNKRYLYIHHHQSVSASAALVGNYVFIHMFMPTLKRVGQLTSWHDFSVGHFESWQ